MLTKSHGKGSIANMILKRPIAIKSRILSGINFLSWSFLFAVIYAQAPLYTSNQNQYFLHGLADAGYGLLHEDWLANTIDPTPVFSLLVNAVYRIFHSQVVYYWIYALLMGLYLWSILGIVDDLFRIRRSRLKTLAVMVLLLMIHSAAGRHLLSRFFNADWTYLLEGGLAGQRLLGTVLQPSVFGIFLVLSIYQFIKGRTYAALVAMTVAIYFHPTYLLSAALLTLGYMWVEFRRNQSLKEALAVGSIMLLLVIPILVYVYLSFGTAPPGAVARAREILVEIRIPHHAIIGEWFSLSIIFQLAIVAIALFYIRRTKLFQILIVVVLLATMLTGLQFWTDSDALALLFPWRISVIIVPLSSSILMALLASRLAERIDSSSKRLQNGLSVVGITIIMVLALTGGARFKLDLERKWESEARSMMAFVGETKQPGDVYLVPTKMQDFRLETGAPIYVDFKSIPYAHQEVLEWRHRVLKAARFYREKNEACELLAELVDEAVTHVVLEAGDPIRECGRLTEIYRDEAYGVFIAVDQ